MSLTTEQQLLIEARITNAGPSVVVAYLYWFFLWFVSAHRFYLGRPGSAVLQILSYFILVGFIWILVDIFLIPGMVRARQDRLRAEYAAVLRS